MAYLELKQYDVAKGYQIKGIDAADLNDAKLEKTKALISLGEIFIAQKSYSQAIAYIITGVNRDKKNAYEALVKAYSGIQDYENAFYYQQLVTTISEIIKDESYEETLGVMRLQFDLENKQREILLLTADNELKQTQIESTTASKRLLYALAALLLAMVGGVFSRYRFIQKSNLRIAEERNKSENILLNILPKETAEELKEHGSIKAKFFKEVTVLFTDFKEFSVVAEGISPEHLVKNLDYFFKKFDDITEKHNLEKIKTIGDAYMAAGGVPIRNSSNAIAITLAALEILEFMQEVAEEKKKSGEPILEIRIGIHTGPLTAGVVGVKKFAYDIWGDTVNIASRMESASEPGKVNISGTTYQMIKKYFETEYRGQREAKGKGLVEMFFVNSIKPEFSENGDGKTANKGLRELIG